MAQKRPHRAYTAGCYPFTVTVAQVTSASPAIARWWDRELRGGRGNWTRRSLGTATWPEAKRFADEKHLELKWGNPPLAGAEPTLAGILALYQRHETPQKSPRVQAEDRRRAGLFLSYFGGNTRVEDLTPDDWREFRDARLAGAVDARGERIPAPARRARRPRVVRAELSWLRTVARWAVGWKVRAPGERAWRALLASNPLEGKSYPLPADKNPRQPVITETTHQALVVVAGDIWPKLPLLLRLANGTGRRLSPMLALWPHDRVRQKTSEAPFGGIRWPQDTDKMGKEWFAPIDQDTAAALDELESLAGPRIAPYFELRPGRPISRDRARRFLLRAYAAAEIEKPAGSSFHVYRRKFVTERPHFSDALVGNLAGMSVETVRVYRQSNPGGLYEVLTQPMRLVEVRG